MYCILVIGMTGEGKTGLFVKPYIDRDNRNCCVFDVQNEYKNLSTNVNHARSRFIEMNEKKFMEVVKQKRNTICVFEEATIFFEGKTGKDLRNIIVSKRHTGNILVFCFHSITSVLPRLLQLTNYVVLFKTQDERYQIEKKYPSLLPYHDKVMKMPPHSFIDFKTIQQ